MHYSRLEYDLVRILLIFARVFSCNGTHHSILAVDGHTAHTAVKHLSSCVLIGVCIAHNNKADLLNKKKATNICSS